MPRGTHFLMTRGTYSHPDFPKRHGVTSPIRTPSRRSHPDYPHSDFPKSTHGALLLSGLPQGEAHDTHKHNIRTIATSHPDDRHILFGYVLFGSLTEVSKSCTSSQQPAMAHVPPPVEGNDKNEVTTSHLPRSLTVAVPPTISVSRP